MLVVGGDAAAGGVEEMLVHADQPGDYGVAGEVEHLGAGRHGAVERGDATMIDDEGLILKRRGSRAIDDADVLQSDDGGIDSEELGDARSEAILGEETGEGQDRQDEFSHRS